MKTRRAAITAAVVVGLAVFQVPAHAATGSTTAGTVTAVLTIQDGAFDGPGCVQLPYQVAFSAAGSLDLAGSQAGSNSSISSYSYATTPGTVQDTIQVCPYVDGAGTYVLRGTVSDGSATAPLTAGLLLTVTRTPATMSTLTARQKGMTVTIAGKVTAQASLGTIGAQGEIIITGMLPKSMGGTGKWVQMGRTYPDEFGKFSYSGSTSQNIRRAHIRATMTGSSWCGDAAGATKVK